MRFLIDLFFFYFHPNVRPKDKVFFHLYLLLYMATRPKSRVLIDYFSISDNHSIKILGILSFILSFFYNHSTLGSLLIYLIYLHMTIEPKYTVLFHFAQKFYQKSIFSRMHMIISRKYIVLLHLVFLCAWSFHQKLGTSLAFLNNTFW